jgi:hypothetical protein
VVLGNPLPANFCGGAVKFAATLPQPVDRTIPCGRRDPAARVRWKPTPRPVVERDSERVLDNLLGEVDVPEDADQCGDG